MSVSNINKAIEHLNTQVKLHDFRFETMEKERIDLCEQLKGTDSRMMEQIEKHDKKLDLLLTAFHQGEGSRGLMRLLPALVEATVGLLAIYAIVRGVH